MNSINMIILYLSFSYIIGSISGSLILGKFWNIDIRKLGSGNAGGTNALRSVGIKFAFLTFIIDLTKGIIPAYLASHDISLMLMCGGASIIGHVYPIFYNFRGGKGAGTLLGVLIIALPESIIYILATWVIALVASGYVGLSTILGVLTFLLYCIAYSSYHYILFSIFVNNISRSYYCIIYLQESYPYSQKILLDSLFLHVFQ